MESGGFRKDKHLLMATYVSLILKSANAWAIQMLGTEKFHGNDADKIASHHYSNKRNNVALIVIE